MMASFEMRRVHAVCLLRLIISHKIVGPLIWVLIVGLAVDVSLAVEDLSLAFIVVLID